MTFSPVTFKNGRGNVLYKALAHPLLADQVSRLRATLAAQTRPQVFDPHQQFTTCDAFLGLSELPGLVRYTADAKNVSDQILSITDYQGGDLLVLDFDYFHLDHLRQRGADDRNAQVCDLNELKLPPAWVGDHDHYLSAQNFVFDFAMMRFDAGSACTISLSNYWARYGAENITIQCLLIDESGQIQGQWQQSLRKHNQLFQIQSGQLAADLNLSEFSGQVLMHAVGAAGHDVLKYVCDYVDSRGTLTTTHDANSWPADRYGGIPLPGSDGEQVDLWIQNPHSRPIGANSLQLQIASRQTLTFAEDIPPLATRRWRLPLMAGAFQGTLKSDRQLTRPRYEVVRGHLRHIAHANVVRGDLGDDQNYWPASERLGRGYLLAAPLLAPEEYFCQVLITPMTSLEDSAAVRIETFAEDGTLTRSTPFPDPLENQRHWLTVSHPSAGHLELSYDPDRQGPVDGWLHAIFRYQHRRSGHTSETSFGCHMFNMLSTYGNEPQSYSGHPPGLRTRLYGRPAVAGSRGFFQLIYMSSLSWHHQSTTQIILLDEAGQQLDERQLQIPLGGSATFFTDELFNAPDLKPRHQVLIRDTSCRLFGYHGQVMGSGDNTRFSIDHLFGF